MVKDALKSYGYEMDKKVEDIFTTYRKTQNESVFDVYSNKMKQLRKNKLLTGLPDTYARGRMIPELARVPLYGLSYLEELKKKDFEKTDNEKMTYAVVQEREEIAEQIKAFHKLKLLGESYGIDHYNIIKLFFYDDIIKT